MNLIYVSIAIFALAAVLGVAILVNWLLKKDVSKGVVYTHGIFAAVGLVILVVYAVQNPGNYPTIALILFVVAALGGFYMFFRDLQNKMSPYSVAFLHGLLAVAGFVFLLVFAFAWAMKVLGHPVHVMLIHFPSALFPMDLICSVVGFYTGNQSFVDAAFLALAGGVLFGTAAIITGAFDLIGVAADEKPLALKKALLHGGINITVIIGYAILAFRAYKSFPDLLPDGAVLLFVKGGLVTLMVVGNYLGGSLILKHRVAVENN